MAKPKSTGDKVGEAMKRLVKLQSKHNFPEVEDSGDVRLSWEREYDVPRDKINEITRDVAFVKQAMGYVPWPKSRG
jgi:hypothetical protein